jgi:hypothetical protein
MTSRILKRFVYIVAFASLDLSVISFQAMGQQSCRFDPCPVVDCASASTMDCSKVGNDVQPCFPNVFSNAPCEAERASRIAANRALCETQKAAEKQRCESEARVSRSICLETQTAQLRDCEIAIKPVPEAEQKAACQQLNEVMGGAKDKFQSMRGSSLPPTEDARIRWETKVQFEGTKACDFSEQSGSTYYGCDVFKGEADPGKIVYRYLTLKRTISQCLGPSWYVRTSSSASGGPAVSFTKGDRYPWVYIEARPETGKLFFDVMAP